MPPGAKKRKALKKKKQQEQQESIGTCTITNGDKLHEKGHGSQDDRESDDSNSSSPASQGNETKDPSASFVNDIAEEISDLVTQRLGSENGNAISVERGTDDKKLIVEKPLISSSHDPCVKKIAPVVDSVSKVVISVKSEHPETLTHLNFDEKKEYPSTGLEKGNGEVATLPDSAALISRKVESLKESEVTVSSEEKRLSLTGPPAVRTSWLSCCGLFDAVTGSDR
ncbi:unnamed protein product [Eruca vesicaria subsp. sativa]|uniref:Uncharacterized protein n=1 Tax=Eruca vesicaria subsp. sativa TaxID=29727 RepID=A0ABC8ITI0_ERUVS|nr:unnamed protein product [Eruca vesicaria subsp. sativa]